MTDGEVGEVGDGGGGGTGAGGVGAGAGAGGDGGGDGDVGVDGGGVGAYMWKGARVPNFGKKGRDLGGGEGLGWTTIFSKKHALGLWDMFSKTCSNIVENFREFSKTF